MGGVFTCRTMPGYKGLELFWTTEETKIHVETLASYCGLSFNGVAVSLRYFGEITCLAAEERVQRPNRADAGGTFGRLL